MELGRTTLFQTFFLAPTLEGISQAIEVSIALCIVQAHRSDGEKGVVMGLLPTLFKMQTY